MNSPIDPSPPPRMAVFLGVGEESFAALVKWLVHFEPRALGRGRVLDSEKNPSGWLLAAEGMRSVLPLDSYFRAGAAPNVEAYVALEHGPTIERPAGLFLEYETTDDLAWRREQLPGFQQLWCENPTAMILCQQVEHMHLKEPAFEPLPAFVEPKPCVAPEPIEIDRQTPAGPRIAIPLAVEKRPPFPESIDRQKQRLYERFRHGFHRIEGERTLEAIESVALTVVPEGATAGLLGLLGALPMEVIDSFLYFRGRTKSGEEMHFIHPARDGKFQHFPELAGALTLECPKEWKKADLHLFLARGLWLAPHYHFSHAAMIREAMLNGFEDGTMLAFFDHGGRRQELVLPGLNKGFRPLSKAIDYANGLALDQLKADFETKTVGAFFDAIDSDLQAVEGKLLQRQKDLVATAKHFFTTATADIHKATLPLDKLAGQINGLNAAVTSVNTKAEEGALKILRSLQAVQTETNRIDVEINRLTRAVSEADWKQCEKIMNELKKRLNPSLPTT